MCVPGLDPVTLLSLVTAASTVAGAATAVMSGPPEANLPATPAPILDSTGATVRFNADDADTTRDSTSFVDTNLTRSSGRSLGGLGRSGLAL